MNRTKTLLAAAVPAAMLALSAPVYAQGQSDAGWYVGAAYGQTTIDVDMTGITSPTLDDSDTGFKIYGGFQFNKHLGAEVGYVDGGKATFGGSIPSLGVGSFTGDISVTAITFAAVGTLPLNEQFALFGKVGLATWDAKASVSISGLGAGAADDSGTDLLYGIGARYNLNRNWGITLEYEAVDVEDSGFNMMSVGVRYKF
ncbi:MAG TPA: outer membrane beta-barrel protein [Burkholderiales bacterium]|jgi:OOP family OmpA-OmpF porin|nr:outer membrane beta-barrel protein [Burkholderiales bacterium]